jgi:hypothetical protein
VAAHRSGGARTPGRPVHPTTRTPEDSSFPGHTAGAAVRRADRAAFADEWPVAVTDARARDPFTRDVQAPDLGDLVESPRAALRYQHAAADRDAEIARRLSELAAE